MLEMLAVNVRHKMGIVKTLQLGHERNSETEWRLVTSRKKVSKRG